MRYYIWLDVAGRPVSKAWPYEDETERMAEERRPPPTAVSLRTGTRGQLVEQYGLGEEDFADS